MEHTVAFEWTEYNVGQLIIALNNSYHWMKYKKVLSGHFIAVGNSKKPIVKQEDKKPRNVCNTKLFFKFQYSATSDVTWLFHNMKLFFASLKHSWNQMHMKLSWVFSNATALTVGNPEGWSTYITVNHGRLPQCVFFKRTALHIFVSYNIQRSEYASGPLLCAPTSLYPHLPFIQYGTCEWACTGMRIWDYP